VLRGLCRLNPVLSPVAATHAATRDCNTRLQHGHCRDMDPHDVFDSNIINSWRGGSLSTGRRRCIGCLILIGLFPQQRPTICSSLRKETCNLRHPMHLRHSAAKCDSVVDATSLRELNTHTHTHKHVRIHTHIYTHTHTQTEACMHVNTYEYVCKFLETQERCVYALDATQQINICGCRLHKERRCRLCCLNNPHVYTKDLTLSHWPDRICFGLICTCGLHASHHRILRCSLSTTITMVAKAVSLGCLYCLWADT